MYKSLSKLTQMLVLTLIMTVIITTFTVQNAYAESGTRANSATTLSSGSLNSIWRGDSYVSGYGNYSKVTLYIATTNVNISQNLNDINTVRPDGNPLFVKFGESVYVSDSTTHLPTTTYANTKTNKFDQIVDYKKGIKIAPSFTRITDADMVHIANFPDWLKENETSNQTNVVSWMKDDLNAGKAGIYRYQNLRTLINAAAEKSDTSKAGDMDSVKIVLRSAMNKAKFDYHVDGDVNGDKITLTNMLCMPGNDYSYWLVVYEPAIYYAQDPNKLFYPTKGGNSFLLSATDAVLANMYSGTSGYPSIVKFGYGTPAVTASYNHCNICGLTWFGYDWKNSSLPLTRFCPLPCPGVSKNFTGVQTRVRHPFAMTTPIKMAAKTFSINQSWLKYKSGYLFDKPTAQIDSLITSTADTDAMLHIGGYSLFVSGVEPKKTTAGYIRTVMFDEQGVFVPVPNTTVSVTAVNDASFKKTYKLNGSGQAPIDGSLSGKILKFTVYKPNTAIPIKTYKAYFLTANSLSKGLTDQEIEEFLQEINNDTGKSITKTDLDITYDTAFYYDETIIKNSTDELDWTDKFVFTAETSAIGNFDDIVDNIDKIYLEGEKWSGKALYITIILKAVKADIKSEPSNNTIRENELLRSMSGDSSSISKVSVQKISSTETTCPGYTSQWHDGWTDKTDPKHPVVHDGYYSYPNCGHDHTLANAKGVTLKTLNVQTAWYWNESMFSDVSKLAILRNSGTPQNDGITFSFNNNNANFTTSNMADAFSEELGGYKFLAHRNLEDGESPLQLATYMNSTPENKAFQSFILPYFGKYPSAFAAPNGNFGGKDINIMTSSTLSNNTSAIGSGSFCSGGSTDNLSVPSKLTGSIVLGKTALEDNNFRTSTNVSVEPTVQENSKSAPLFIADKTYWGIGNPDQSPSLHVRIPSSPISFYPTFKMSYDTKNDGSASSEVWMLSSGKREFNSNDYVLFSVPEDKSSVKVDCPWSRDRVDKYENPEADDNNLAERKYPTAKSGTMLVASTGGTTLRIDVIYHIQDPAFTANPAATQTANDALAAKYDAIAKSVRDNLKNGGMSYYSNLLQANTKDTLHFLPSSDKVLDLSAKTTLKLGAPVIDTSIVTQVALLDTDDVVQSDPDGKRTINVQGKSYSLNHTWVDTNAIKSQAVLDSLLVKNGGKTGFYTEGYEGIILVHRVYFLTIKTERSYCQIHLQLSDSLTPRNECAHKLPFIFDNTKNLIEDGQFGIGLEIRLPNITLPDGTTIDKGVLPSKPFLFDIRGSVYDTSDVK